MGRRVFTTILSVVTLGTALAYGQQDQPAANDPMAEITARATQALRTAYKVKYVAQDTVYLSSGKSAGLAEGMKLEIRRVNNATAATTGEGTGAEVVATLEVIAVTDSSAVCNITKSAGTIQGGDYAFMTREQAEVVAQQEALGTTRKYPQVITFSEGDPLEEEVRDEVPRPALPEVNRIRGRIGYDFSSISSGGANASSSSQNGVVVRADITRLWGTHWNISGYWRGTISRVSAAQTQSLQDMLNRTYHLSMTYDNPQSHWVAGVGRMFVPWASSLETIDGGYFGRKFAHRATAGMFAGSTPDPTSWSYDPSRRLAGAFVNFEGGSYDHTHFTSTSGLGVSTLNWKIDRPFVFFENNFSYKRYLSVYHSLQADNPRSADGTTRIGSGISRSFATVRFTPVQRVAFDLNHNFLRDVPTIDPRLIGTGLLDKYLFTGFSGGVRVETWKHVSLYTNIGRSNRSGDVKNSWNRMYGVTAARIWKTGVRADFRYSDFDSSFAKGTYKSLSFSREVVEGMRLEMQLGEQKLVSQYSSQRNSRFANMMADINLGSHYFMQSGFTAERGGLEYNQWSMTVGYRFDNHSGAKRQ